MTTYDALEAQINQCYGDFSGTDKKLADVLLSRKSELLGYSATELADLASVSKASAARFFRRLGYADFGAFRQALRDQRASQSPLAKMDRAATPRGARTGAALPAIARLQAHVQLDAHRLAALPEQIGERVLDTTLRELADARRVWVVGYRNSFMLAFYANALLSQVRPEVYLLNEQAGKDAELIAEIDSKDVLFAVDFRRRARRLAPIITLAAEAGAKIILLSDAAGLRADHARHRRAALLAPWRPGVRLLCSRDQPRQFPGRRDGAARPQARACADGAGRARA
ncbi:MurR/RpiR family transcriptional regulator [Cupriavidus necator]